MASCARSEQAGRVARPTSRRSLEGVAAVPVLLVMLLVVTACAPPPPLSEVDLEGIAKNATRMAFGDMLLTTRILDPGGTGWVQGRCLGTGFVSSEVVCLELYDSPEAASAAFDAINSDGHRNAPTVGERRWVLRTNAGLDETLAFHRCNVLALLVGNSQTIDLYAKDLDAALKRKSNGVCR